MKVFKNRYLKDMFSFIVIISVSLIYYGCTDIPSNLTQQQKVAEKPVTVFGKVIDAGTRLGISGAKVYLNDGNGWKSTTTSSGDITVGDFSFSDLPANATLPIVITGPSGGSYVQINSQIETPERIAVTGEWGPSPEYEVNSAISLDLGQVAMSKGVTLTLYVKDINTGSNVTAGNAAAIPIYWDRGGSEGGSILDVLATQNSTDTTKYTIVVHPANNSTISVPNLDIDADGIFDYLATSITVNPLTDGSSLTRTVMLTPVVTDGVTVTLYIIDSVTGNYVTRVDSDGNALPIPITGKDDDGNMIGIIATQDTTNKNKYTVKIPQSSNTTLIVPDLDTNGDNVYDYLSGNVEIDPTSAQNVLLTRNIVLSSVSTTHVTVNLYVVDSTTGAYVSRKDSAGNTLAIPIYSNILGNLQHTATQDTSDTNKYSISLPQNSSRTLTVPAFDSNGDGIFDYQTANITVDLDGQSTDLEAIVSGVVTRNVVVVPITDTTPLSPLEENNYARTVVGNAVNAIGKSGPIKLLFNVPVSLATEEEEDITLTYMHNFQSLAVTAVEAEHAVTVSLSAGNTVISVSPTTDLTENQTYELRGTVRQASNGYYYDLVYDLSLSSAIYVYATGAGTIGSTPTVTVDNQNYWTKNSDGVDAVITTGDTKTLVVGAPNLLFPEKVWGDIRLVKGPVANAAVQKRALTGKLTFRNGETAVSGSGTQFAAELAKDDTITAPNGSTYIVAAPITSDTVLTLTANYAGTTSPTEGETAWVNNRGGTIACTAGNATITGTNTVLDKDLSVGDIITFGALTLNTTTTFYKVTAVAKTSMDVSPAVKSADAGSCNTMSNVKKLGSVLYSNNNVTMTISPAITFLVTATSQDPLTPTTFNSKGANRSGAVYAVDLNTAFTPFTTSLVNLTDSTTDAPLKLTLGIDVVDLEGNAYQTESEFEIQ